MAMSMKPQKAKSKSSFLRNLVIIGLVIALLLTIIITNYVSSAALRNVVQIAVLKEAVPKDGTITSVSQFEKQEMQVLEYERQAITKRNDGTTRREIILWDDLPRIINGGGAYAAIYIPAGRPVYYEDLSSTGTQKNSYLYTMDGELLKLDITPDDFGDMVVPGDKLNVRITYKTTDYTLPTEGEYAEKLESGVEVSGDVVVTETLFSEVAILDMLNGDGESIFDLYYELLTYPTARRSQIVNSDSFKDRVAPECILLSVTSEEAERYAYIQTMSGEYLITLLPRDGTTEILDALDELKTGFARE